MTTEQVPLAEQIEAVQRALKLIRNIETPFTVRDKEALDAAAATLQQHERAMAVVEAARAFCDAQRNDDGAVTGDMLRRLRAALDAANPAGDAL